MNCWCDERTNEHRMIEKQLRLDKKRKEKEMQILFFGKSGSGKSTLFRQLKVLHGSDCTEEDRSFVTKYIYQNIFTALQTLIAAMSTLKISFADQSKEELADSVTGVDVANVKTFEQEYAKRMKQLWLDSGIQECYNRKDEFRIADSAKYFLDDIERISHPQYSPSQEDILRVYIPTIGLHEYTFEQSGHSFRLTDYIVPKGRTDRRIWVQFFEKTHAAFYVVDISVYHKSVEGFDDLNELDESKELFRIIHSNPWLSGAYTVTFFNKTDLFDRLIMRYPLSEHFPRFTGPKQDTDAAKDFIKQMFLEVNSDQNRVVFNHFTCATDTSCMKRVYDDVIQSIVQSRVKGCRLL